MGPSPRVRGKRGGDRSPQPHEGSIPAGAGETHVGDDRVRAIRVHPRGCGGNYLRMTLWTSSGGPSPRVRGKRLGVLDLGVVAGSIPAGAGETRTRAAMLRNQWVHPRGCGGNVVRISRQELETGPSPRVRGKLEATHHGAWLFGSIPAGAGETAVRSDDLVLPMVHPRGCGGNSVHQRGQAHQTAKRCPSFRRVPA